MPNLDLSPAFLPALLALTSAVLWGISDFGGGVLGRRAPIFGVLLATQAVGFAIASVGLVIQPEPMLEGPDLGLSLLAGGLAAIGVGSLYRGLAVGRMGVVAPVTAVLTATTPAVIGIAWQGFPAPIVFVVLTSFMTDDQALTSALWPNPWSIESYVEAERRFREAGADNFAAYVAGGQSDVPLPAGFKLDAYGQVGILSGKNGGHFFDGQMRVERQILPPSPVPLHVGAGIWTGGQKGVARVDIGPTLRTELPIGESRVRINTDWRFRVAGNASPGNGPALTVSTGF